jgi:hypothetical protein
MDFNPKGFHLKFIIKYLSRLLLFSFHIHLARFLLPSFGNMESDHEWYIY